MLRYECPTRHSVISLTSPGAASPTQCVGACGSDCVELGLGTTGR
jgi:hypothetical protein